MAFDANKVHQMDTCQQLGVVFHSIGSNVSSTHSRSNETCASKSTPRSKLQLFHALQAGDFEEFKQQLGMAPSVEVVCPTQKWTPLQAACYFSDRAKFVEVTLRLGTLLFLFCLP